MTAVKLFTIGSSNLIFSKKIDPFRKVWVYFHVEHVPIWRSFSIVGMDGVG